MNNLEHYTEIIGRSKKHEAVPIGFKSLLVKFDDEERIMVVGSYCFVVCSGVLLKIRIKNIK
jgi:hypothetical protein